MSKLPAFEVKTPQFISDLVPLHFHEGILLDAQTNTRWKQENNTLVRDHRGECEWEEMAGYVGKAYIDVFMESYRASLETKQNA